MENKSENKGKNTVPQKSNSQLKSANNSAASESFSPSQPNGKKGLIVILAILLLALAAAGVYYFLNSKKLAEEKAATETQLQQAYYDLDSIGTSLDQKILMISQLGGEVDSLVAVKAELEEEKAKLRRREINQGKQINALKSRVGGYKELLLAKDKEIEELQKFNTVLVAENNELKEEKNKLNKTLSTLNTEKTELQQKVAAASQLKMEEFVVYAINKRGKEYKNAFRNRQIKELKIQFSLAENKVAPIEGKNIIIRVIGLDGNVLFDVAKGSGTFLFEGREQFFTAKQEVLYDRSKKEITFIYDKGSDYEKGVYQVEVYGDDYLLGKGSFTVK